jgi:hypothetical protein
MPIFANLIKIGENSWTVLDLYQNFKALRKTSYEYPQVPGIPADTKM